MDNKSRPFVSLKKSQPQPWTDPVTGEIYPGGNPNASSAMPGVYQPGNVPAANQPEPSVTVQNDGMKFCKFCGKKIHMDAVICTHCGRQVEQLQSAPQIPIVINNNNANNNVNTVFVGGRPKSKWVAFALCLCFGFLGIHRFYEGKILSGLLWMFTLGLFFIGWFIDLLIILTKPNTYYV